jgi:S1-C subfamily serine protease
MFGFNWIDLIIILFLIGSFFWGIRIGGAVELCTVGGFFAGLFLAGWLFPHVLPIHDHTLRTIINGNAVLLAAILAAIEGNRLGHRIRISLSKGRWHRIESDFGFISAVSVLVIVWLVAPTIGRLPFAGFSNSVDDSLIVQTLENKLPSGPVILALFNRQIDPNSSPKLFTPPPSKPQAGFEFSPADFQAAETSSMTSVVRITGFGCGGIESGSGFVVGKDLIATNAHVVAGVTRPIIKYNTHSYTAVPVLFDANLDFAVLRISDSTNNFHAPSLTLALHNVSPGATIATIGYPDGDYAAVPGIIRNNFPIFGRNIYNFGVINRDVYQVQTSIDAGSSGSPIVLSDGRVAGIIFAKDQSIDQYAYALSSPNLLSRVQQAEKSYRRISTGPCLAN